MKPNIRMATKKDAKAIASLNRRFFHEEGRHWAQLISGKTSELFACESGKAIIGFSGLEFHAWNNSAQIIDIFVHPEFRQQGYGEQLVKFAIRRARRRKVRTLFAEAPSKNLVKKLYQKCGFRICGFNDRYYSNSGKEKAIFLSKDFKQ